ncbi:hypothetical protein Ancab_024276 [Ancistrocladus abbreviatus]
MGSLGGEAPRKAMWLYPKAVGFNPSERWGHSACYSHGLVYIFGGCCGGLHFSDVIVLNLTTMAWSTLTTTGNGPGPRDSHSTTLWGSKMVVFGGTNGSKKVNDLHILDLGSNEWIEPICRGTPPSPRESHTATLVGDEKLVVFGGSGEGVGNYLNDLHILDLKTMRWSSPEVKGEVPRPRDSHTAVSVGNKLFVYGGDCGDRYHGEVDVFDVDTVTWTRLLVQGSSPGARAGHVAVTTGTKIYVIGGVGDKTYYNDAWVLDTNMHSWAKLDICGQPPQGRFSHTAVVTEISDIAIYGGCGEDERPLRELLILQLGAEHPNGRYNISLCKNFGNHSNQEKRQLQQGGANNLKTVLGFGLEAERLQEHEMASRTNQIHQFRSDTPHPKRRKMIPSSAWEVESEPEEHSLSVSQQSSPSQSDHEQTSVQKTPPSISAFQSFPCLNQPNNPTCHSTPHIPMTNKPLPRWMTRQDLPDASSIRKQQNNPNQGQHCLNACHMGIRTSEERSKQEARAQNVIGAEVQGKVDGVFDAGYLMTATVNGRIYRGVLFAPAPGVVYGGPALNQNQNPSYFTSQMAAASRNRPVLDSSQRFNPAKMNQPCPVLRASPSDRIESKHRGDLQGVVLTLGGPGTGHG